ncbi:MAG: GNAT family N-acetyltransferase, partial [Terriglobales bacterium]
PWAPAGVAERLLRAALQRGGGDLLRLQGLRRDAALVAALEAVASARGLRQLALEEGEWLPWLELPADFEALLAGHSPNFRAEVRRRRRAFLRRVPQARVECAQSASAVSAALEHLFRLHNLRRQQKNGCGVFESQRLRGFHRAAAAKLAASGQARVYLLRTHGEVLAALYGFQAEQRFLYFQSGFDPACAELSPGTVMLSAVIEDSIQRGLTSFEFLRGDEGYKSRWTSSRRRNLNALGGRSLAGTAFLRLRAHWIARTRVEVAA